MADQLPPTDGFTAVIHPDRARRLQKDDEGINQSKRTHCSNCGKSHHGTCAAVACRQCKKKHLPDLDWCHHCKKCGGNSTKECTKRFQRSHGGSRPDPVQNTSTRGNHANPAPAQTGNVYHLADMTPTQWQDFLGALRNRFQPVPATASTGRIPKRPGKSQRSKQKKKLQVMKDRAESESKDIVKKEGNQDDAGGNADNVATPSGAMAA